MSEEVQSNNQQMIVIALVVIAALMAAIVGILIWQQTKASSLPEPTAVTTPTNGSTTGTATGTATGMGATTSSGGEYDPKTAPKVPAGTEPEAYVRSYYELCEKGQYDKAFKMLPTATQSYYGDAAKFKSTLEGYGITGFTVKAASSTAKEAKIVGSQSAQGMEFAYTWTLVKDGSTWLVKSREMGGQ